MRAVCGGLLCGLPQLPRDACRRHFRRPRRCLRVLDRGCRRPDRAGQPRRERSEPELHRRSRQTEGMAIDSTHIYWVTGLGAIGRANLDGTSVNESFILGAFPKGWRSTALTSTGRPAGLTETGSGARTSTAPVSTLTSSQPLSAADRRGGRQCPYLLDQQRNQRDRSGEPRRLRRQPDVHHRGSRIPRA